ncbi:MAG: AAA-like domain-containing protein [Cyanosarcina radialis HA8281-LM2]|jgi:WD40 repeat protein|nr:AAA-like domain-containing protein [Cyanosarcina radialis HA8281-LM2]
MLPSTSYEYQVGGSLKIDAPSYIPRHSDIELYEALKAGEFCYVLNSRQMGKSSLRVRVKDRLEREGFKCVSIDLTGIGSENIAPGQWYKGIISELCRGFNLLRKFKLKSWWQEREDLSPPQRLQRFVEEVLLVEVTSKKIFVFIDEIDSVMALNFPTDDFFALIRFFYNQRAEKSAYDRLTVALFGVATPSDLIRDRRRTPFNIGKAIELQGFQLSEAMPLARGLEGFCHHPESVLTEILQWTGGQPFLTQKVCQLAVTACREGREVTDREGIAIRSGDEKEWVDRLVRSHLLEDWEDRDRPEHLKTIRTRLLDEQRSANLQRLLGEYQRLLEEKTIPLNDSPEQTKLLLSGLVVKQGSLLAVRNPIYREIFNLAWVEKELARLRPYAEALRQWVSSDCSDESHLLRGKALQAALEWSEGRSLTDWDYRYLVSSQSLEQQERQRRAEIDRLKQLELIWVQEIANARLQRYFLQATTAGAIVCLGLVLAAFLAYHQTSRSQQTSKISQIQAIATSADALFLSDRRLEALVQAIRAKQQLNRVNQPDWKTQKMVDSALRQSAYGVVERNSLSGHEDKVNAIAFSPDGGSVASGSVDRTIKIWQPDGRLLRTLTGHNDEILDLAFSPDDQILVSASGDGTIKFWNRQGILLRTFTGNCGSIYAVAFSHDGQTIASACGDGTVKIWNLEGKLLKTLKGHQGEVWGVDFSSDGRLIASSSRDNTVKLWSASGQLLATLKGHSSTVRGVAFSPIPLNRGDKGGILATASDDRTVKLWRTDGTLLATLPGHNAPVAQVKFSPDGQRLVTASWDNTIAIWHRHGTPIATLKGHRDRVWDVAFSPDGQTIASASWDNTVKFWQPEAAITKTIEGHTAVVIDVAFSADGKMVASSSDDRTLQLWKSDNTLTTLKGHSAEVYAVAFSPDNRTIASASNDRTIKLWRLDGSLSATLVGHTSSIWGVDFSPDGRMLVSGSKDGTVRLWNVERGERGEGGTSLLSKSALKVMPWRILKGHSGPVWAVDFSANGQLIVSASDDRTVKLWTAKGKLLTTLKGHRGAVQTVAIAPIPLNKGGQEGIVASGSADRTVKLWKTDGTLLATLNGHTSGIKSVKFSPNGELLASASADKTVKLWKLDGSLLATLSGHSGTVWTVDFSPDSQKLASGGEDLKVIIWDLKRVLQVDLLAYSCQWARDYLRTNDQVQQSDRDLCN